MRIFSAALNLINHCFKVGELIAVMAEDGEDWKEVAAAASSTDTPSPSSAASAAAPGTFYLLFFL